MRDDEVALRLGVMDTIARYTRFGDAADFDTFCDQFTEDGVLETKGRVSRGRGEILAFLGEIGKRFSAPAGFLPARHHVSSVFVEPVDADHANARSYFLLVSGNGPDHWGRYRDTLVRVDGVWRFTHRRVYVEASVPGSPVADQVEA